MQKMQKALMDQVQSATPYPAATTVERWAPAPGQVAGATNDADIVDSGLMRLGGMAPAFLSLRSDRKDS